MLRRMKPDQNVKKIQTNAQCTFFEHGFRDICILYVHWRKNFFDRHHAPQKYGLRLFIRKNFKYVKRYFSINIKILVKSKYYYIKVSSYKITHYCIDTNDFLKIFTVQSTIYIGNMEQNSKKPSLSDNSIGFVEKFESTENTLRMLEVYV